MENKLEFKNKEVQDFFDSSTIIYNDAALKVAENFDKKIEAWSKLIFTKFDCENHYNGELKNTIFIYHHDHSSVGKPIKCSPEYLIHPHTNIHDRGYTKGIALDLTNYLLLKTLHHGGSDYVYEFSLFDDDSYSKNPRPRFKITKHMMKNYDSVTTKDYYSAMRELNTLDIYFDNKKKALWAKYRKKEDAFVKHLTGLNIDYRTIKF